MRCERIDSDAGIVLHVEGTLDVDSAHELASIVAPLTTGTWPPIVLDLAALRVIDSAGTSALVSFCKQVRAHGGDVHATGLRRQPLAIFQLLRLDQHRCAYAPSEPVATIS